MPATGKQRETRDKSVAGFSPFGVFCLHARAKQTAPLMDAAISIFTKHFTLHATRPDLFQGNRRSAIGYRQHVR